MLLDTHQYKTYISASCDVHSRDMDVSATKESKMISIFDAIHHSWKTD
jgi:hypothetical protein